MKRSILALLLLLSFPYVNYAQELPNLKQVKLGRKASYKNAEPTVQKVVAYLFATPIDKKNKARNNAGQFLTEWMNGTPDYIFYLEERETSFFNTDSDLLLIYMAALAKFPIANPAEREKRHQTIDAMNLALPYLYQHSDKKLWTKELWQLYDSYKNNAVASFMYP